MAAAPLPPPPSSPPSDPDLPPPPLGENTIYAVSILACGLIGGLLPLLLRSRPSRRTTMLLGIGSSFGGGVFIAAGTIHLLPDSRELLDGDDGYPVSSLIFSSTILLFLLVEAFGKACCNTRAKRPTTAEVDFYCAWASSDDHHHHHHHHHQHGAPSTATADGNSDSGSNGVGGLITTIAMYASLSFHSMMAGLSLGVLRNRVEARGTFAAIVAHKSIAAFALGAALVRTQDTSGKPLSKLPVAISIVTFSFVTPIGVMIGTGIGAVVDSWVSAAFTAIAAGTFIFVGLVEIAVDELGIGHGHGAAGGDGEHSHSHGNSSQPARPIARGRLPAEVTRVSIAEVTSAPHWHNHGHQNEPQSHDHNDSMPARLQQHDHSHSSTEHNHSSEHQHSGDCCEHDHEAPASHEHGHSSSHDHGHHHESSHDHGHHDRDCCSAPPPRPTGPVHVEMTEAPGSRAPGAGVAGGRDALCEPGGAGDVAAKAVALVLGYALMAMLALWV